MAEQTYVGTVRSFNPIKGWGFVECAETKLLHGTDIFLLKGELNGFGVAQGDQVSFQTKQGPKGIQATNVKVLSSGPDGLQSFFGEIKSFNAAKGFGFISSPAAEQIFGKDVFVLKSEFKDGIVPLGGQVQFKAKTEERGPVATDVRLLNVPGYGAAGWAPSWQEPGWGGSWGGQSGDGRWGGAWGAAGGAWKTPSESEIFFGHLKSVNVEKGWGHISSEAMMKIYNKDIFVLKSTLEALPLAPGQCVSFSVQQGTKGPHAINVKPFDETSAGAAVFSGKVRSFNEGKGWGFIQSPEASVLFLSDIFVHKKDLNNQTVVEGDEVQFTVDISSGRAAAKNVSKGYGAARPLAAAARASPY